MDGCVFFFSVNIYFFTPILMLGRARIFWLRLCLAEKKDFQNNFFFCVENGLSLRYIRPLFFGWDRVELFKVALKLQFGPSNH